MGFGKKLGFPKGFKEVVILPNWTGLFPGEILFSRAKVFTLGTELGKPKFRRNLLISARD